MKLPTITKGVCGTSLRGNCYELGSLQLMVTLIILVTLFQHGSSLVADVFQWLVMELNIGNTFNNYINSSSRIMENLFGTIMGTLVLICVANICFILGLLKKNYYLMIPNIIFHGFSVCFFIIFTLIYVLMNACGSYRIKYFYFLLSSGSTTVSLLYYFMVMYSYYKKLKEENKTRKQPHCRICKVQSQQTSPYLNVHALRTSPKFNLEAQDPNSNVEDQDLNKNKKIKCQGENSDTSVHSSQRSLCPIDCIQPGGPNIDTHTNQNNLNPNFHHLYPTIPNLQSAKPNSIEYSQSPSPKVSNHSQQASPTLGIHEQTISIYLDDHYLPASPTKNIHSPQKSLNPNDLHQELTSNLNDFPQPTDLIDHSQSSSSNLDIQSQQSNPNANYRSQD